MATELPPPPEVYLATSDLSYVMGHIDAFALALGAISGQTIPPEVFDSLAEDVTRLKRVHDHLTQAGNFVRITPK